MQGKALALLHRVQAGSDHVLAAIATGVILQVILDN
jgi:Ni/Co efflux regulator RcnB